MAESHIISTLTKKRSEILGEIQYYEQLMNEYKDDLSTINKAILIFDEDYDLDSIKPIKKRRNKYFSNGEAKTMILDLLRNKKEPLKTDEIGAILGIIKGLDMNIQQIKNNFNKSIVSNLALLEKQNLVERVGRDKITVLWQIKQIF